MRGPAWDHSGPVARADNHRSGNHASDPRVQERGRRKGGLVGSATTSGRDDMVLEGVPHGTENVTVTVDHHRAGVAAGGSQCQVESRGRQGTASRPDHKRINKRLIPDCDQPSGKNYLS